MAHVSSGKYLGKYVALKLLFTVDLTVEIIRRVASEAALLSAVKVSTSPSRLHPSRTPMY